MKYYIGIDGGGTKTGFCLTDESLNIISEYKTTGCYYPIIGKDGVIDLINNGINICLNDTKINIKNVTACCGLPAYGEIESLMESLPEIAEKIIVPIKFCNDAEVCHAGALNLNPGMTIIAGTGSIGFGQDENKNTARSGGFGPEVGGDEGSGYWIGMKLIQTFTRQVDYREERTLLYDEMKKALDFKSDFDVCTYVIETIGMERDKIASLATLAEKIARMGDPACKAIYFGAAREIYLLALSIKKQLDFTNLPIKVSYAGSIYKSGDIMLPELSRLLEKDNMILTSPLFSPVIGACLLAKDFSQS